VSHYQYLQSLSAEIDQPVTEASLKVEGTNVVAVPGQVGRLLDVEGTLIFISAQMQTFRDGEIPLVVREQAPEIVDVSAQEEIARRVLSEPMRLYIPNAAEGDPAPWTYDVQILANMLTVQRVGNEVQVALQHRSRCVKSCSGSPRRWTVTRKTRASISMMPHASWC
jgi:hypothetical protein